MDTVTKYLAVAAGGALGAMLRLYLGGTVLARTAPPFPTATFVINVSGSFLLGLFLTLVTERFNVSPQLRLAVAVGFIGAYTTFSTFEYETARLVADRDLLRAGLYVGLSFAVGLAAVWLGIFAARKLAPAPRPSNVAALRCAPPAPAAGPQPSANAARARRAANDLPARPD